MSELSKEKRISFLSRKLPEKPPLCMPHPIYLDERMASALLKDGWCARLPNVVQRQSRMHQPFASCEKPGPCGALHIAVANLPRPSYVLCPAWVSPHIMKKDLLTSTHNMTHKIEKVNNIRRPCCAVAANIWLIYTNGVCQITGNSNRKSETAFCDLSRTTTGCSPPIESSFLR